MFTILRFALAGDSGAECHAKAALFAALTQRASPQHRQLAD
jgi:hypothetical protein